MKSTPQSKLYVSRDADRDRDGYVPNICTLWTGLPGWDAYRKVFERHDSAVGIGIIYDCRRVFGRSMRPGQIAEVISPNPRAWRTLGGGYPLALKILPRHGQMKW